jgi:hypothetical protein
VSTERITHTPRVKSDHRCAVDSRSDMQLKQRPRTKQTRMERKRQRSVECSRVEDRVVGLCSEGVACDAGEVFEEFRDYP